MHQTEPHKTFIKCLLCVRCLCCFCWQFIHTFLYSPSKIKAYKEGAFFSALKAYNARSWPGGDAISIYTQTFPLIFYAYIYILVLCIVNTHWCRNRDRLLTIFTVGIRLCYIWYFIYIVMHKVIIHFIVLIIFFNK